MTGIRIFDEVQPVNLRRLAAAVCLRAFEDVKGKDGIAALDAVLWLSSPAGVLFLSVAGLDHADPLQILLSGKLKKTNVKMKGNQNAKSN